MAITITCLILEPGAPCSALFGAARGRAMVGAAVADFGTGAGARSCAVGSETRPHAALRISVQARQRGIGSRCAERELQDRPQLAFLQRDRIRLQAAARAFDHSPDV